MEFNPDDFLRSLRSKREGQIKQKKQALENLARSQGRIARCPNCDYIIPFTEESAKVKKPGNILCAICKQEFNENFIIREAERFRRYEEAINKELAANGFKGKIKDLRKVPDKKVIFLWSKIFWDEYQSRQKQIKRIFQSIIPRYEW